MTTTPGDRTGRDDPRLARPAAPAGRRRCRSAARAARSGCAARSSPTSPACRSTTSSAWSRAGPRRPRRQVVAALARALQLSRAERDHLYRLARPAAPADGTISDHIPPGVQRVLDRLGDVAVAVFAADWQLVWWNHGWAALLGDPSASPPQERNLARASRCRAPRTPSRSGRSRSGNPDATDAALVSDLRRATGRFPRDRRLAELIRRRRRQRRVRRAVGAGAVAEHARTTRRSSTRRRRDHGGLRCPDRRRHRAQDRHHDRRPGVRTRAGSSSLASPFPPVCRGPVSRRTPMALR